MITRSELIANISNHKQLSLKQAEVLLKIILDSVSESLAGGDRVEIRGLGTFCLRKRQAMDARNPKTGEKLVLDTNKKRIYFRAGKELRERVSNE